MKPIWKYFKSVQVNPIHSIHIIFGLNIVLIEWEFCLFLFKIWVFQFFQNSYFYHEMKNVILDRNYSSEFVIHLEGTLSSVLVDSDVFDASAALSFTKRRSMSSKVFPLVSGRQKKTPTTPMTFQQQ